MNNIELCVDADPSCNHADATRIIDEFPATFLCPDCYGVSVDDGSWTVRGGAWLLYGNGCCESLNALRAEEMRALDQLAK